MSAQEIKAALGSEIESHPNCARYTIIESTQTTQRVVIKLKAKPNRGAATTTPLTEDFVNAGACWYNPTGTATVSQVDPNNSQVTLANVKNNPPQMGQDTWLYPHDYITPVLSKWEDDNLAQKAIACLNNFKHPTVVRSSPLSAKKYPFLRPAQRHALNLVMQAVSFLYGPPGTGKTTTLAVVVAEFLISNPSARVLLVASTNLAVDQLTVATVKFCEKGAETGVSRQLHRVGRGYDRRLYAGREYLLSKNWGSVTAGDEPVGDAYGEPTGPFEPNCNGVTGKKVRLYAMTIASCIANMTRLRELGEFDFIVCDEASQISLPQTLLVMTLGKACLLAGDPEQLAPIVTSKSQSAQRWLSRSAFAFMPTTGPTLCFLNEQSRMAGPICKIVSEIFYGGLLRVANDAIDDPRWLKSRTRPLGHIPASEHVRIERVDSCASRTHDRNGWTRIESAQRTIDLVLSALKDGHALESEIVIITPYRLQRAHLLEQLSLLELPNIKVSTVHSCQGSEAAFVIFDPVCGKDEFLMSQVGRQMINVAFSRAQAKLIVMLSAEDFQNPIFAQMAAILERDSDPMAQLLATP